MAKQFTEWAREVLNRARAEAGLAGSGHVQTEHLLLAICREPESTASRVLEGLGVDLPALTAAIENRLQPGAVTVNADDVSFAPQAKKVIELAVTESQRLDQDYIGTEHLLLALLTGGESLAASLLGDCGIDPVRTQAEIERLSEPDTPAAAGESGFSLTPRVKEALQQALAEMVKEREGAIVEGAYEKATWWRGKECELHAFMDETRPISSG